MVPDAALRVLADGERAVVGPRHPRVVLVLCGADVYQSSVERRQARVADVIPVRMESLRWLNPTISQRRRARRVREDDRVDDRADAGRGLAEAPFDFLAVLEDERRAERALLRAGDSGLALSLVTLVLPFHRVRVSRFTSRSSTQIQTR